jgi:hypothetical protein
MSFSWQGRKLVWQVSTRHQRSDKLQPIFVLTVNINPHHEFDIAGCVASMAG